MMNRSVCLYTYNAARIWLTRLAQPRAARLPAATDTPAGIDTAPRVSRHVLVDFSPICQSVNLTDVIPY